MKQSLVAQSKSHRGYRVYPTGCILTVQTGRQIFFKAMLDCIQHVKNKAMLINNYSWWTWKGASPEGPTTEEGSPNSRPRPLKRDCSRVVESGGGP